MIVRNLIKDRDYNYIEWRITLPESMGGGDTFSGSCESKNGKLIPHDQDYYSEDEEVIRYKEWSNEKIKNGLTVVVKGNWI